MDPNYIHIYRMMKVVAGCHKITIALPLVRYSSIVNPMQSPTCHSVSVSEREALGPILISLTTGSGHRGSHTEKGHVTGTTLEILMEDDPCQVTDSH